MSNRCIIFDLDGTLIDSRKDLAAAVNLMRQDFHLHDLPVDDIVSYLGNGAKLLVERTMADAGFDYGIDDALSLFKKHYESKMLDQTLLYPGVADGIKSLTLSGWKLAVITNKPTFHCLEILKHFSIDKYFGICIGGDSGFPLKPEPDSAFSALEKSNSKAETSWIVGDHYTDMATGRKAGLKRCFANYGFGKTYDELFDAEISSFSGLPDVLNGK